MEIKSVYSLNISEIRGLIFLITEVWVYNEEPFLLCMTNDEDVDSSDHIGWASADST